MKTKSLPILLVCAFVLAFVTCKKEPDPNIQSFELTKEDLAIGTTSATIEGTYSYAGVIDGIKVCLKENGADKGEFDVELDGNDFSVSLTGLKPAMEYQYHYAVDYGFSKPFNTETKTFTTLSSEKPTVKALEVQRIDSTTYRIKCQVVADGGTEVTERGICWNTFGDPVPTDDSLRRYEGAAGLLEEYLVRMEHLASGKKYYVRAYAKNAAGKTGLSEEVLDFETEAPTGTSVEIELSCDPEDGGRVTGDGSYDIGTQCTAIAEANAGYTFVNWTENGNQVSSEAAYTFTVTVGRSLVANFTKQAYVIYAEVEPVNSGTVTGATGYDYGQECTLTATPNTGYDFQKWTKGGTTVSINASYPFTVTETATYKAHFTIKSYTIGVSVNPTNGGTVEGGGTYDHGQSCTVKATPADGYAFTNWTDDGEVASESAEYPFTVTGSRNLVANFKELQANEYSIQVSANPTEGGTVTGGGTYHEGDQCTVNANSNAGFTFINWTENGNQVSDLAEYPFTVTGNRVLMANFEAEAPAEYTINVSANPSNGGTVTGGGTYQQGDQCTVEATANEGYTFINWTTENGEEASTNARYTFIVNSDRNLVANFQVQSHTISVSADPTNGGSVSGGGTYNHGENCTVSATVNNGYTFTNWTEGGNVVSTNANYTFTVTVDRTLVANFQVQAPNTYNINVSANPPAGGTVDGGGSYQQGHQCTVTATVNEGYTFLRWTENGNQVSANPSYTFTVTGNRTLVAHFQVQSYTISVSANPTNGGSVTGGGTYNYGQSCTVTATPSAGYLFANWKENGNVIQGAGASYTFTVTGNRTLVAQFQQQQYTITATANPTNGGTISGNQSPYTYGQTCSLTATPASGYTFIRWTENGNQVSTNPNYSFTVTGNRTLVAQFQAQQYTITATANPTNGGTISGNQSPYTYGQTCSLTATPASGYTFIRWTENGNQVSTNPNYSFTVTSNRTLVAQFQQQQYTITATANPTNGGTISGNQSPYTYGQTCSLTATPASGYTFIRWTENGNQVSTNPNYSFTVTGNRTLVAQFQAQQYTITATANPTNGGTISGNQSPYTYGQTCSLTATPASGYTFIRWTENGNQVSTNPNYSFTVTGNRTLVAQFQAQQYTITATANPTNGGTISGNQSPYTYGQTCSLTATSASNYSFANWAENGSVVSTQANYQFTVTSNRTLVANFQLTVPQGAINGLFSVSASQQMYFSQGNLQYIGSAAMPYWKFADNQWDVLGTTTGQNSTDQNLDRDLFGWGTSGYDHGAFCYQPWSTSQTNSDYYAYGDYQYNLYDQTGQADWGYNPISNGSNQTNRWRTLTATEWNYVFNTRATTSGIRYAKANVNDVNGVILLPDDWDSGTYSLNSTNSGAAGFSSNTLTASQWSTLEQAGAVFLPAAGYRSETSVYSVGSYGSYWSASSSGSSYARAVRIGGSYLGTGANFDRYDGRSVRLVCPAEN